MTIFSLPPAQFFADFGSTKAIQIQSENHADGFGLILVDNVGVAYPVVADDVAAAIEDAVIPDDFPPDTLRDFAAFFLGQGRHDGQPQFAVAVHRPNIILDKVDLYAVVFQLAGHDQRVHRVAGKLYVFRGNFKVVAGALIAVGADVFLGLVRVSPAQRISTCAAEVVSTGAAKAYGEGMVLFGVQVNTNGQSTVHTVDVLFP